MFNLIKSVKRNPDLYLAALLALISLTFTKVSLRGLASAVNPEILLELFCLMVVTAGLRVTGFLDLIYLKITPLVNNARRLSGLFIFLNFFTSMFVTNDVSLIIFIPLSISALLKAQRSDLMVTVISLQTVAANMGSMLTPIGNPQNLFIYNYFRYDLFSFFKVTFPVFAVCFILLFIFTCFIDKKSVLFNQSAKTALPVRQTFALVVLFMICILSVLRVIEVYHMAAVVLLSVLVINRKLLIKADYKLLLLFVFLFIFVSNLSKLESVSNLALTFVKDYEFFVSFCLSQIISNVPATVMLSGFAADPDALLLGVNVGGLGTIIASMASLISFKFYVKTEGAKPLYYMKKFTKYNIEFLLVLLPLHLMFPCF